jgi:hypothetical protein
MTDANTDALAKLLADASDGPWAYERETVFGKEFGYTVNLFDVAEYEENERFEADFRLAALAPTLAAEVITLRAEVARLRVALKVMAEGRKTEDAMGGHYGFILDRYIDGARAALAHGKADQ